MPLRYGSHRCLRKEPSPASPAHFPDLLGHEDTTQVHLPGCRFLLVNRRNQLVRRVAIMIRHTGNTSYCLEEIFLAITQRQLEEWFSTIGWVILAGLKHPARFRALEFPEPNGRLVLLAWMHPMSVGFLP